MLEGFDPNSIQNIDQARQCIVMLLNLVEELKVENRKQMEEVQRLRDENNRLKGEQGRPTIKPNKGEQKKNDLSSEKERHKPEQWQKSSKVDKIKIDRKQLVEVDKTELPKDAEFKGYEEVVVQDLSIHTDNVQFLKEKYYSASQGKTWLASLPAGYEGEFGPGVKSMAIVLYYGGNMTQPKIGEWFAYVGIKISEGQLSNMLIKNQQVFHAEKEAVYEAGLKSSPWQQIDDTMTRVNGQNQHCHVVCNPLYTAYFTTENKDRLTVLDVLRNFRERRFRLNKEAFGFVDTFGISTQVINKLKKLPQDTDLSQVEFLGLLKEHLPNLGPQQKSRILESAAIAAYHAQLEFPVVKLVVCDDAPQFKLITEELALCWVHDGRHYKKLVPYVAHHLELLETFRRKYWDYYDKLLNFGKTPTLAEKEKLSKEFDELFSTATGYHALDERIAKSKGKKECLLLVLEHPEIPLHNNAAELAARVRVRKRDVSFGPRTQGGKKAWDTFNTLVSTAKKLGVSFFQYVHDRVSGARQIPSLDQIIAKLAEESQLGGSWDSS
jgi:hypothetical protein